MPKVSQTKPLSEIILRRFERPFNETREELLKKFCISLGLLQPGDSRDVVIDIFGLLLENSSSRKEISSSEIERIIKERKTRGSAGSNIRRQLSRLIKTGLIERINLSYRIREFHPLEKLIDDYLLNFQVMPTIKRIKEYAAEIDKKTKES